MRGEIEINDILGEIEAVCFVTRVYMSEVKCLGTSAASVSKLKESNYRYFVRQGIRKPLMYYKISYL